MLHNETNWQAVAIENWHKNKQKCLTIVVKQSFEYDDNGNVFAMENSEDIVMADEMSADPASSSLASANEVVAYKQGFELYGNLTAYPPKSKQVKVIEVNIGLTQNNTAVFSKTLRVTGDRVWKSSLLGVKASDPQILKPTALTYENTYGGIDSEKEDKHYEANPAGSGYRLKQPKGNLLPKVEYPNQFIKHPKNTIAPASYSAIPQFWQPRLALVPDVNQEALMNNEYPYKTELAQALFNYAPEDQQLTVEFNEHTVLSLKGVSPNKAYHHHIELALPYSPPLVVLVNGEEQTFIDLTCDTLVLNSDANNFHLLWRKSIDKTTVNAYSQIVIQQNVDVKTGDTHAV